MNKNKIWVTLCVFLFVPAVVWCQQSRPASEQDGTGVITLAKCIENLAVKGDLRLRYEIRDLNDSEEANDTIERMQTRFRLGLLWKNPADNWEIGAGLATGGLVATSANDTWGEEQFFEKGDIRMDYAYASHDFGPVKFIAGQQINPFETSWLLWDTDVRPAGFTLKVGLDPLFATLGGYDIRQYDEDFGILYAAQFGAKTKSRGGEMTAAVTYYGFNGEFERRNRPVPGYEFTILDLYAQAKLSLGDFSLTPYAQVFNNFGAEGNRGESILGGDLDPEEENTGWIAGMNAGIAKYEVKYAYIQLGADSFVPGLTDATFGSGVGLTDVKGHFIGLAYAVSECFSLGTNVYVYDALERDNQPEGKLYQLELNYKF